MSNGKEAISKAALGIISQADAERIADALYMMGYVCVPKEPTKQMLDEAWAYELAEDARGVWREMINTSEGVTVAAATEPTPGEAHASTPSALA